MLLFIPLERVQQSSQHPTGPRELQHSPWSLHISEHLCAQPLEPVEELPCPGASQQRAAKQRAGTLGPAKCFHSPCPPCPLPKQHQSKRQLQLIRNVRGPARDSGEGNQAL